jgi:glycosyltransferase involved in cell wall biosynthesis
MARIDVLLPVYNVESYVAEALASIQAQTLADIEIVIVDDCSTDNTLRIVEGIARTDPRIRVIRTPHNFGLTAALNLGLDYCYAPFIARMDGDDIALPTRLEKQLRFLEENPDIALVGCATVAIDESGNPVPGLEISRKPSNDEDVAKTMLLASPCSHIWLARSGIYASLSKYRDMKCAEDYDFLLRALAAEYRISNLAEPLMLIRKRAGNLSSGIVQRKAHHYVVRLYRERLKYGHDSFSPKTYEKVIRVGKVENASFRLARMCLEKGTHSHSRVKRALLIAFSAILSPLQARYLIDRVRFRIAMRPSKRDVRQLRAARHVSDTP